MLYIATHQSFHSSMEPVVDLGQIKGMTSKVQTALKKVTKLKNKARREFRQAQHMWRSSNRGDMVTDQELLWPGTSTSHLTYSRRGLWTCTKQKHWSSIVYSCMLYVATHQSFHSSMEPVVDLGQIKGMTRKSKVQTALKKVTMPKNKARRSLDRLDLPTVEIHIRSLTRNFYDLVRQQVIWRSHSHPLCKKGKAVLSDTFGGLPVTCWTNTLQFTEERPTGSLRTPISLCLMFMSNLPGCPFLIILQWSSTPIPSPLRRFKQSSNDPNQHPLLPFSIKSHTKYSGNTQPSP